jgi:hypothetical protein
VTFLSVRNCDFSIRERHYLRWARSKIGATRADDLAATEWGNRGQYDPNWVFHGLLIGTPGDAVRFLHRLMLGEVLPRALLSSMRECFAIGRSTRRPAIEDDGLWSRLSDRKYAGRLSWDRSLRRPGMRVNEGSSAAWWSRHATSAGRMPRPGLHTARQRWTALVLP